MCVLRGIYESDPVIYDSGRRASCLAIDRAPRWIVRTSITLHRAWREGGSDTGCLLAYFFPATHARRARKVAGNREDLNVLID